ncbi:MAG: aldehyde dehydrogenase family protein, partial [Planctomycetota bacterium]
MRTRLRGVGVRTLTSETMAKLSAQQVDEIAARVIARLSRTASGASDSAHAAAPAPAAAAELAAMGVTGGETTSSARTSAAPEVSRPDARLGVFPDVDSAVAAAGRAFQQLSAIPLSRREGIIAAIRQKMREHGEELAELAYRETGLGRTADKVKKNQLVTEKTPGTEDLAPLARSGDHGLTLTEPAPFGVIGAITPTTNPTSTIICNTIGMVAAGNAVVFNVHPNA